MNELGTMSFYWQQALQNQDTSQNSNSNQNQNQQQGQWDYINLGGPPNQNYQWNPAGQQQQNYSNYPQQHQQPQANHQYQGSNQNADNQQYSTWNQQQQSYQQHQQQQHPQHPQQTAPAASHQHQPQKRQQQQQVEHTPILTQHRAQQSQSFSHPTPSAPPISQAPPVQPVQPVQPIKQAPVYQPPSTPQQQQYSAVPSHVNMNQQHSQSSAVVQPVVQQTVPEPPRQPEVIQHPPIPTAHVNPSTEPTPEVNLLPPVVSHAQPNRQPKEEPVQFKTPQLPSVPSEGQLKPVTSSSSEDDWEKADMEVHVVQNEVKKQQAVAAQSIAHDTEKADDSRESSLGGSWSQNDQENSERNSVDQQNANTWEQVAEPVQDEVTSFSMTVTNQSVEDAEVVEIRQITPDVKKVSTALDLSSPGEAQATSTPKDIKNEKRGSTSSQKTLVPEEPSNAAQKEKLPVQSEKDDRDDASGNNSDSTVASGQPPLERGNLRASYRHYKQQYTEILKRLNGHRIDKNRADFRPSSKLANPLLAAAGFTGPPSVNRSLRNDGRASVPLQQSQSFTEDLYSSGRSQRVSRLEGGRPSSRQAGYPASNQSFNMHQDPRNTSRHSQQAYQQGRYSTIGVPYRDSYGAHVYDPRRPQSHCVIEQQFSNGYDEELHDEEESRSESGDEEASGDSEDELRQYNMRNPNYAYNAPTQSRSQFKQPQHVGDGAELYYLGVVHIDLDTYHRILERQPPPPEYYDLKPIEKAAFMFFAAVYKQQYKNVDAFHKRFNREFFKYVCAGDTNDVALYKICKSMQDQYVARMQEQKQNYEAANKHLFSDDNSVDGQSDINSLSDDLHSTNSFREPLHFSFPHAFMTFGVGGKTISVHPEQSISVVAVDDVKRYLKDVPTLRIFDSAQTFKGPLIPNQSPPHTVRLYISKQIELIKRSEVAQENPHDNDVVESLLVWQLLETMVKQQGNITGPDIAELLAKVASQPVNIEAPKQISDITPALNQFTQFLLGGHVDEAVEGAIRNGLFADALVLTRRLYPNNEKKIAEIEERFLQTRSVDNPVTTLVSVASGLAPPVLTNPPLDNHLSWRTHAAIILANLDQKDTAMNTIYHLGRALAKREYFCAADFCFLVGCVLAGYDPFQPIAAAEGEEAYRRHISLVSSGLPDDEDAVRCQYGFSVTDLHATEIFDYALRLKPERGESPLARSVEYQTARMKYAKLLASHGYTTDAYRYCVEIARSIWDHFYNFNLTDLLEMCDLAESLHYMASAETSETLWIEQLRTMCQNHSVSALPPSNQHYNQHQQFKTEDTSNQHDENYRQHDAESAGYEKEPKQELHGETHTQQPYQDPFVQEVVAAPPPETPIMPTMIDFLSQPQPNQHIPEHTNRQATPPPPTPIEPINTDQHLDNGISIRPQHQQHTDQQYSAAAEFSHPQGPSQVQTVQQPVQTSQQPILSQSENQQQPPSQIPQQQTTLQQNQPSSNADPGALISNDESRQNGDVGLGNNGSRGWLGSIRDKVSKAIPAQNQMILPDDKQPSIKWDPVQNKYIGDGVVEESTAPPPPSTQPTQQVPAQQVPSGGLRSARGASRYAKVGLSGSSTGAPAAPTGMAPPMPLPTTFGFMPAPVDDGDSVDPFSGQANPTIQQSAPLPSDE